MSPRRRLVALVTAATALTFACAAPGPDDAVHDDGNITMVPTSQSNGWAAWTGNDPTVGIESIIGPDGRRPADPTRWPGSTVGQITRGGAPHCTGTLIGPSTVLTAGHCLHSGGAGGTWYAELVFHPGRTTATTSPTCGPRPGGLVVLRAFAESDSETHDVGVMQLACPLGNTSGWLGAATGTEANGTQITVSGYPFDTPDQQQGAGAVTDITARLLYHDADTAGGMSGAAVRSVGRTDPASPCASDCVVAVHAYGLHGNGSHATANHGVHLSSHLLALLDQLRQDTP